VMHPLARRDQKRRPHPGGPRRRRHMWTTWDLLLLDGAAGRRRPA